MMTELTLYIQDHIQYAHWIIFFTLLLAGLNIPVSEDLMIFTAAILAKKYPDYLIQLFFAVYLGAYFSDLICYMLGNKLGPKLWRIKWFAKMVSHNKVAKINQFYKKFGMITLFIGRFFPFGIRNALFLTAGLGKMNLIKFSLADFLACTLSTATFFYLYHRFGEALIEVVKQGNIILFSIGLIGLISFLVWKKACTPGAKNLNKSSK